MTQRLTFNSRGGSKTGRILTEGDSLEERRRVENRLWDAIEAKAAAPSAPSSDGVQLAGSISGAVIQATSTQSGRSIYVPVTNSYNLPDIDERGYIAFERIVL